MEKLIIVLLSLVAIVFGSSVAEASWLIDPGRFHASVHGQTSCQDCHEDIEEQKLHPNPENVNKRREEFFSADQCFSCHDDVMEVLDQGMHGSEKVLYKEEYLECLSCHSSHYELESGPDQGPYDPARPIQEQCGVCHDQESKLPPLPEEDGTCMTCHLLPRSDDPGAVEKIALFCFHCHAQRGTSAQKMTGRVVPLIDVKGYGLSSHVGIACTECHYRAAEYSHGAQSRGDCRQCHVPHDEKVAHDSHAGVACEACHLKEIRLLRDPKSLYVRWERERNLGEPLRVHDMVRADERAACQRCHLKGNQVGAASMVLPAKSILCMPCHAATFSVGDTISIVALIVFLGGLVMLFSVWLSGSLPGVADRTPIKEIFRPLGRVISAMVLDVLLQRRLYRQSRTRWLIHSLIFLPFAFRFCWGLVALIASLWRPEWSSAWAMLDKDHPATALLFDITGTMVILGVVLEFLRGTLHRPNQFPGVPRQDLLALGLIAAICVIGFMLEGIRIAMTGRPENTAYAFIGFGISRLFSDPSGLTDVYGYIWYIHAILTGAFIAYLPFSRLSHIIVAPVVLAANAIFKHDK